MKYIVVSDSHGDIDYLKKIIEKEKDIDNLIFLGDGINDIIRLKREYPRLKIDAVKGNCDINADVPAKQILNINGFKVMMCHGDGYQVKMSLLGLRRALIAAGVDIALYGHTHHQYYEYFEGMHFFCPGSVCPSCNPLSCYGIIDFSGETPLFYHKEI